MCTINFFTVQFIVVLMVTMPYQYETRTITLYEPNSEVEIIDASNFDSELLQSSTATVVKFFANWCGHCQRFSTRWKQIANNTKLWHERAIRVAAVDCALPENEQICTENRVEFYPKFAFFKPFASSRVGINIADELGSLSNEDILKMIIEFVEKLDVKPLDYPELDPYRSDNLFAIFDGHPSSTHILLVFESAESLVGRKLILDFSSVSNQLVIQHVTFSSNPGLFEHLSIPRDTQPVVYLLTNIQGKKNVQLLDIYMQKHKTNQFLRNKQYVVQSSDELRLRNAMSILELLEQENLSSKDVVQHLIDGLGYAQVQSSESKDDIPNTQTFENPYYNVQMIDLESGLNYMLRQEVARWRILQDNELFALKQWLRVLVDYFPGREPVMNYLSRLSAEVNLADKQIDSAKWKSLVTLNTSDAHLPSKIEYRHCNGSSERYRGYPCTLWTLFHVLSVNRAKIIHENELRKSRISSSQKHPTELIEAIRGYIARFFGCRDCSENFANETEGYEDEIKEPVDDIMYLWDVHNRVNERLAGDPTEDPKHPKILFPSKFKCPGCYLNDTQSTGIVVFSNPDVLTYLQTFYSIDNIEGAAELNARSQAMRTFSVTVPMKSSAHIFKPMTNWHQTHWVILFLIIIFQI